MPEITYIPLAEFTKADKVTVATDKVTVKMGKPYWPCCMGRCPPTDAKEVTLINPYAYPSQEYGITRPSDGVRELFNMVGRAQYFAHGIPHDVVALNRPGSDLVFWADFSALFNP